MHFVLFNGPPGSGKDTAAKAVYTHFAPKLSMRWEKFSFPNKRAFAGMMKANIDLEGNVAYYEQHKNEIVPELGVSYRQWQIDYSEKFMKPLYGEDVFARLLWDRVRERAKTGGYLCVISDCGFQVEVDYLAKQLPGRKALLIRLFRDGYSYAGDSRADVRSPSTTTFDYIGLHNLGSQEKFEKDVVNCVTGWLANTEK